MPSKSPKQRRFMAAVAHNPDFARRAGVPQSVGKEFNAADQAVKAARAPDAADAVASVDALRKKRF